MTKFRLNMIVKNESKIIVDCLETLAPVLDSYAILDTGSTDDTPALIEQFFADRGIPGAVGHGTFKNFEQARNDGIDFARNLAGEWDYLLFCDADMRLVTEGKLPPLEAPAYALLQDNGAQRYYNVRMLHRDCDARYLGVTHEYLKMPGGVLPTAIAGWWYRDLEIGANREHKYKRDAELLNEALRDDPENPRLIFYMVQSLYGLGMVERALEFCAFRISLDGLEEENWWAKLQFAGMSEELDLDEATVQARYLDAFNYRPKRPEPMVALAKYHRKRGNFHLAAVFAHEAIRLPMPNPPEILPVDVATFEWKALDEFLIACVACGRDREAKETARVLRKRKIADNDKERVLANCAAVLEKKK